MCDTGFFGSTGRFMKGSLKYSLMLVLTALIWGSAFVAQSEGMDHVGPMTFICIRFIIGGLFLIPIISIFDSRKKKEDITPWSDKSLIKGGVICGVFLFLAASLQQIGIKYTVVGKAGFITAFYIVLVPIFSLFLKKKPGKYIWVSVVIAVAGLYLLCIEPGSGFDLQVADLLLFACAVLFSFQIMAADKYAPMVDPLKLASIEFLVTGVLGIVPMILEKPTLSDIAGAWLPLGYAAFFSSGIAYTLQMVAQRRVKPAVASLLMSLESVFSVIFGFIILREILTIRQGIGCIIMFVAIVIAQFEPKGSGK